MVQYSFKKYESAGRNSNPVGNFDCSLCRNSLSEVFSKKSVLENLAKFTGKHLCWSLFFKKVAGLRRLLLRVAMSLRFRQLQSGDSHLYTHIHDRTDTFPANTQRWFNVDICWNIVATSVNVISTLIQCRLLNVDSSIKFNVETALILGWL